MSGHDTPAAAAEPVPHPLARRLLERLPERSRGRVLLLGIGSGRNVPALLAAELSVEAIEDDADLARAAERRYAHEPRVRVRHASFTEPFAQSDSPFAAALSTHALLHGTQAHIAAAIASIGVRLADGAPFYATLGSTTDPRYRTGRHVEANTFAPIDGSEAGVPHTYFDEPGARALFADFAIEELAEESAARSVGRWAHSEAEAAAIVHWVVRATRTQ